MRPEGLGLLLATFGGTLLLLLAFLYPHPPLIALAVSILLPGLVLMTLTYSPVPPGTVRHLMESAAMQVEALLEEFKPLERAVYAYRDREGVVAAIVPIRTTLGTWSLVKAVLDMPFRTLVETASGSCLQLLPPAAAIKEVGGLEEGGDVEASVAHVLTDVLEFAEDVRVVTKGNRVYLTFKPLVDLDLPRFNKCMGSLASSVAACVVAVVTGRPARLVSEDAEDGEVLLVLELGEEA